MKNELFFGDSLAEMDKLIEQGRKFHLIYADIPFGTTNCKWDVIIPFDKMWERIDKLSYPNTVVLLCGQQPFSSSLILSNIKDFRYQWVYQKSSPTGGLNSKHRPMVAHEDVMVFSKKVGTYNPQKTTGHKRKVSSAHHKRNSAKTEVYGSHGLTGYDSTERHPLSVQKFSSDKQKLAIHSTQKPVALGRYMIKTYMNKGEDMLDFTCGSGSFIVAAELEGMNSVGIDNGCCEKDKIVNGYQLKGRSWVEITQMRLDGLI